MAICWEVCKDDQQGRTEHYFVLNEKVRCAMTNEDAPVKEKPNYYAAYKELQALKETLRKEGVKREEKREEERKKEIALQPLIAEYRQDRESAEKELPGKTIKSARYIKNIGVWLLIFTDDSSLLIGAIPPNGGTELGGFYNHKKVL